MGNNYFLENYFNIADISAFTSLEYVDIRFTDLWKWVQDLPGFDDDPHKSNEKILEAIQINWIEEVE